MPENDTNPDTQTNVGGSSPRPWTEAEITGAKALLHDYQTGEEGEDWDDVEDLTKAVYLSDARAVLDAVGGALINRVADEVAELVQDLRDVAKLVDHSKASSA